MVQLQLNLAGMYCLEKNDEFWAQHYLSQACIRYSEWNAHVKVGMIHEAYDFINFDENKTARFAIQGKSRFDTNRDSMDLSSGTLRFSMDKLLTRSQRNDLDSLHLSNKRWSGFQGSAQQE